MRQYIALGNKLAKMGRRSASAVKTRVSVKTPSYTLYLIKRLNVLDYQERQITESDSAKYTKKPEFQF